VADQVCGIGYVRGDDQVLRKLANLMLDV